MKKEYKNIVVLTGSGISEESGIDTFRDYFFLERVCEGSSANSFW